jgi:hypothetical protein
MIDRHEKSQKLLIYNRWGIGENDHCIIEVAHYLCWGKTRIDASFGESLSRINLPSFSKVRTHILGCVELVTVPCCPRTKR